MARCDIWQVLKFFETIWNLIFSWNFKQYLLEILITRQLTTSISTLQET